MELARSHPLALRPIPVRFAHFTTIKQPSRHLPNQQVPTVSRNRRKVLNPMTSVARERGERLRRQIELHILYPQLWIPPSISWTPSFDRIKTEEATKIVYWHWIINRPRCLLASRTNPLPPGELHLILVNLRRPLAPSPIRPIPHSLLPPPSSHPLKHRPPHHPLLKIIRNHVRQPLPHRPTNRIWRCNESPRPRIQPPPAMNQ